MQHKSQLAKQILEMALDAFPMCLTTDFPRGVIDLRPDELECLASVSVDQRFGFGTIASALLAISTELKQHRGGSIANDTPPTVFVSQSASGVDAQLSSAR